MKKIKRLLIFLTVILVLVCVGSCASDGENEVTTEHDISQSDIVEELNDYNSGVSDEVSEKYNEKNTTTSEQEKTEILIQEQDISTGTNFAIHYIDVGQADASLVICDGKSMLIDGGNSEDSSLIYAYLKEHEITEIEYMICTHAHEDHVGGLAGALNYATVKNVLCPTQHYETEAFQNFVKYVGEQNKEIVIPHPKMKFSLGSAECTILAVNTIEDDPNNSSIVMRIDYGKTSFLFSGDAEQTVETQIIEAGYDVKCTVMKIPHHGSDTSLSYRWLNEAMPKYGVISAGEDNQYGHPCENTLSKLRDADVQVYRTDMQGHIICVSDGNNVEFSVQRNSDAKTLANSGSGSKVENNDEQKYNENDGQINYILNVNTKKIHYPSCSSVDQMKEKNKQETNLSKEELFSQGYTSCGRCKP